MSPADPILDYGAFRRYRVPVRVAREVCDRHGLPRPKRIVRLKRGEVNALFRLDFDQKSPLIFKVWVRPSGPEVMELHVSTVSRVHHETGVPTPGWLCISSGDDLEAVELKLFCMLFCRNRFFRLGFRRFVLCLGIPVT